MRRETKMNFGIFFIIFLMVSLCSEPTLALNQNERIDKKNSQVPNVVRFIRNNQLPAKLEGKAKLELKISKTRNKNMYVCNVLVDISHVWFDVKGKGKIPGVLGAYALGVKFDKKLSSVSRVLGGSTKEFSSRPVFTNLKKANSIGMIKFTAVHTHSRKPTGKISVARIFFIVKSKEALKRFELWGNSLSTSILFFPGKKMVGPFSIPFQGNHLVKKKGKTLR